MGKQRTVEEIFARLESDAPIPQAVASAWLSSRDIEVQAAAKYLLLERGAYDRVSPYLEPGFYHDFLQAYYERCLRESPDGEYAPSAYLAGHEVVSWFVQLWDDASVPRTRLEALRDWLERLYREGDADMRLLLETAILEHLLEHPEIARFFCAWPKDPILAPGYEAALAWGKAHNRGTAE